MGHSKINKKVSHSVTVVLAVTIGDLTGLLLDSHWISSLIATKFSYDSTPSTIFCLEVGENSSIVRLDGHFSIFEQMASFSQTEFEID